MSYQIGIDTIYLKPTERLAHTEYCSNDALKRHLKTLTGQSFEDAWEIDLIWSTNDGPVDWEKRGRTTDMGHAEFLEGGVDRRDAKPCPFTDVEQVYNFDAVQEYGQTDLNELIQYYENHYRESQKKNPDQIYTGGYYKTIVSGAIQSFGWDMLLTAAAERKKFEKVLDSFFRLSLHHFKAWAKTSIEVFICHDDMVWTQGAFMHPDFYRTVIFPRYKELWAVLKNADKKILFCSDGNWTEFVDDIVWAGADGFIFEPITSLEVVVGKYGKTHAIAGSKVDCRTLTFSTKEQIKAEIDATFKLAYDCPGFFFAVGNHIPSNVPVENAMFYFDYLRANWTRKR